MPEYSKYKVVRLEDAAKDNPLITPWVGGHVFAENLHVLLEHADNVPGYECTGYQELAGQRVLVYRQREERAPSHGALTEQVAQLEQVAQMAVADTTARWPWEYQGTRTGRMSLDNRVENMPRADTTQFRARVDDLYEQAFPEPAHAQVSEEVIEALVCMAGTSIGYWAGIQVAPNVDGGVRRVVYDAGVEGPPVHSDLKSINSASIWAAVLRILAPDFEVAGRIREQFRGSPAQWPEQVDDEGADVLMQVICFGEIVYG